MKKYWVLLGLVVYVLLLAVVIPFFIGIPANVIFDGDAVSYSRAASNLLERGFYSIDGVTPFIEREPGMSFFLMILYAFFGVENPIFLVLVQATLFFIASLALLYQLRRYISERAAGISLLLLLTSGSVFHTIFSAYRESLTLSLLMFFCALIFSIKHERALWKVLCAGLILGSIILTNYSFVFFPFFFFFFYWFHRKYSAKSSKFLLMKDVIIILLFSYSMVSVWAVRNYSYDQHFRVISSFRTSIMWYVRGEQAQDLQGTEPLLCLWAEYISRDWTDRSTSCSVTGLFHQKWPDGQPRGDERQLTALAHKKILQHPFGYAWNSIVEILELHIPFVGGGWSFHFNLYTSITMFILYIGFFFGLPSIANRDLRLLFLFIFYNTAVFILTDATPRYLLPVFFCYAAIAGIGYDALLKRLTRRS